jgi:hypothetical protein
VCKGDLQDKGHTLLHEITHLDSFGVQARFPEAAKEKDGKTFFKYHGTDDWEGNSRTSNARKLLGSSAKGRPETWQNAESLAAAATEIYAMRVCSIKDISL